ncbi:hypothetical protein [Mycolicibacterium sp. 120270]|uniref:hypothetical protein n=1 Tax=Mycolicibacterium sp. 120270 TaxID=3090600 RepID=UPI00299E62C0|nr:hypothetical protein [Mycolicibacterium sp. 120270]MDX1886976.1 hypothetical protein [Mycolicibacterium sp. 120270]
MTRSTARPRRKQIAAGAIGAATAALAIGGLLQPAVSYAEKVFDQASYDKCAIAAEKRWVLKQTTDALFADELKFCCQRSGGVWTVSSTGGGSCRAETATAETSQVPLPSQVATGPGQSTLPDLRKG